MRASAAVLSVVCLAAPAAADPPAPPSFGFIYGFNYPSWSKNGYETSGAAQSLSGMAAAGAGWVAIVPTWYLPDKRSAEIGPNEKTASDASVRAALRQAKALGLRTMLKPHVNVLDQSPTARLKPDDPDAWFEAYGAFLRHYAVIAREERADAFIIGTELYSMTAGSRYRDRWEGLIAQTRAGYPGPVSYAANWFDFFRVPFWGSLDFIGVDAYFPLLGGSHPRLLRLCWKPYLPFLNHVAKKYRKPIVFTEIGVASRHGANKKPWNYKDPGSVDLKAQTAYFQAFLKEFRNKSYFGGFLIWDWELDPDSGGPADNHMTVQGKPALALLKEYFQIFESRALPPPLDLTKPSLNLEKILDDDPSFD